MLAGSTSGGALQKILFPIVPEYIGYANQLIEGEECFVGLKPLIENLNEWEFKYRVDFDNLKISSEVTALCLSRPTNPTGNVVSDKEMAHILEICRANDLFLIVDHAYGNPFPGMIFTKTQEVWDSERTIHLFSLSKFGLPAVRTGIVVGPEEVIERLSKINAILNLASGSVGHHPFQSRLGKPTLLPCG